MVAARAAKRDRLVSPTKPATAARKTAALAAPKYSWAALGTPPPSHEVLLYYLIAFRLVFWGKLDTLAQRPPDAGPLIAALPDGWFPLEQLGLTARTLTAMLQTSPPKMVALVQMLRQPEMVLGACDELDAYSLKEVSYSADSVALFLWRQEHEKKYRIKNMRRWRVVEGRVLKLLQHPHLGITVRALFTRVEAVGYDPISDADAVQAPAPVKRGRPPKAPTTPSAALEQQKRTAHEELEAALVESQRKILDLNERLLQSDAALSAEREQQLLQPAQLDACARAVNEVAVYPPPPPCTLSTPPPSLCS